MGVFSNLPPGSTMLPTAPRPAAGGSVMGPTPTGPANPAPPGVPMGGAARPAVAAGGGSNIHPAARSVMGGGAQVRPYNAPIRGRL